MTAIIEGRAVFTGFVMCRLDHPPVNHHSGPLRFGALVRARARSGHTRVEASRIENPSEPPCQMNGWGHTGAGQDGTTQDLSRISSGRAWPNYGPRRTYKTCCPYQLRLRRLLGRTIIRLPVPPLPLPTPFTLLHTRTLLFLAAISSAQCHSMPVIQPFRHPHPPPHT